MGPASQKPIGSGFTRNSTAMEVIRGTELTDKIAVVTGGYSGIGIETTRALCNAGATVIVPARRPDIAKDILRTVAGTHEVHQMDLADLNSVRAFTEEISTRGAIHLLINNAGIMACPEARVGPGWEMQFGVNHLGHMALYLGLRDSLAKAEGARVVALSSIAHNRSDIIWDDPHFKSERYHKWNAYGQAKTANALFALGVNSREENDGIKGFSVHPGGIFTPLQRHLPEEEMVTLGWKNADGSIPPMIEALFKSPEQGAATTIWAATSDQLNDIGGVYCEDVDVAKLANSESKRWEHVQEWACNPEKAETLWEMSQKMLDNA